MIEMTYHEDGNGYEGDYETQIVGGRGWAEAVPFRNTEFYY